MKKVLIRIFVGHPAGGTSAVLELRGDVQLSVTGKPTPGQLVISEHDIDGALFAIEFAANSHASGIFGRSIRVHIFDDDQSSFTK